jgi:FkbM family methyltransferase
MPEAAKMAFWRYQETPRLVTNRWVWGIRRALLPYLKFRCWVKCIDGAKFFLGDDRIDDIILGDVLQSHRNQYFPQVIDSNSANFLILDVGAHHGIVAAQMLRHYRGASVIAVEPNPRALKYLRKNLAANGLLGRAEIIAAAVGSEEGMALLRYSDEGSWGDSTAADKKADLGNKRIINGVAVPQTSLAKMLRGRHPDLVKCNAEGAEFTVFPQLFSLGLYPRYVVAMMHPEYGSVEHLVGSFLEAGYDLRLVGGSAHRPTYHGFLRSQ